jgi:hypothetical protein
MIAVAPSVGTGGGPVGAVRLAEAAGSREDAAVPGRVFPAAGPRPTTSRGEVTLYKLLTAKLPEGWYAWHSLPLTVGPSEWIGEGDYVIACPDRGILVLEVKSGQMRLEDGIWYQNGIALKKPPIAQATAFAHHLVEEIARAGGGRVPFGAACVFPDMGSSDVPEGGALRGAVLGRLDLARLEEAIPALVERIVREGAVPMFARWRKIIHDLWGERWVACVRLPDQVGETERRLVELDREQFATIEGWAETPRAFITGRAGTGKTIVALAIALRWARAEKRVLYLCFTDPLALGVEAQLAEARAEGLSIEAAPVRKYAEALLKRVGIDGPVAEGQTHWDEVSLHAAADALPKGDLRPDFAVVDEGQDFADSDWTLVDALTTDRGLWVFGDDQQRFWGDRKMPDALAATLPARNRLRVQHRQAPTLAQMAARFAGEASAGGVVDEDRNAAEEGNDEVEPVRVGVLQEGFRARHARRRLDRALHALEQGHELGGDVAADLVVALGLALYARHARGLAAALAVLRFFEKLLFQVDALLFEAHDLEHEVRTLRHEVFELVEKVLKLEVETGAPSTKNSEASPRSPRARARSPEASLGSRGASSGSRRASARCPGARRASPRASLLCPRSAPGIRISKPARGRKARERRGRNACYERMSPAAPLSLERRRPLGLR